MVRPESNQSNRKCILLGKKRKTNNSSNNVFYLIALICIHEHHLAFPAEIHFYNIFIMQLLSSNILVFQYFHVIAILRRPYIG